MIRRILLILAAALVISKPASADTFVIRDIRIFDGAEIIDANSVAVTDGQIVAVGNDVASPPNAQVIEGRGDTLLPGLIDSHVHAWIRAVLEMALMMGVTTELDMYMRWEDAQKWKAEEAKGAFDIADFRTAGTAIAVAGGHGTEPTLPPLIPIRGPDEAQAFVDERIAHGSDYIKVFFDNGPRFAAMSKETLVAIVKAAHARHKMVIVHGGGTSLQGFLDVVDSGANGFAHLPIAKLPESAVRDALKTHHIFAITTLGYSDCFLSTGHLWSKLPDDPYLGPYLGPLWRRALAQPEWQSSTYSYADNEAALRMFRDAGTPILAGTDSSNSTPAGALLHAELELMVKAGLTPSEALAAATSVPAKMFGLDVRGGIASGMRADLLLVRGDPTKDIRATRDIVAIWKQGVRIDRESYRARVAQENIAWKFGAGWQPDNDAIFKGSSQVRLQTVDGGPDQAPSTLIVDCDVKSGIKYPFAGAMYSPALALRRAPMDLSGGNEITFWARGDGKTEAVAMFTQTGKWTPVLQPFVAGKEWEKHTMPFSQFHTDGHDIALVSFVATTPGKFHFEISGVHVGASRIRDRSR